MTALVVGLVGLLLLTTVTTFAARLRVTGALTTLDNRWLPAQQQVAALQSAYVDQQTADRGFLLTGDPGFLVAYARGQATATGLEASLRRLVAPDASAAASLRQVVAAHATWQKEAAAEIAARRAGPLTQEQVDAMVGTGQRLFDALRATLAALSSQVAGVIGRDLRTVSGARQVVEIVVVCSLALALVALLVLPFTRRILTRPLERLVAQLQTVAGGQDRQPIEPEGATELVTLANAAEQMRRSLVDRSDDLVAAQRALTLGAERDRFAAELHDRSVQRLFALGLSLSSLAKRSPELAPMIMPLIDETDRAVRELRGIIFDLTHDDEASLQQGIDQILRESARVLGFTPDLALRGPVNGLADGSLAHELLAVLREALSNVVRHARASRVDVVVAIEDDDVHLVVSDDGVGPEVVVQGNGLRNMQARAARLGGSVELAPRPGGGARLEWRCPRPT